MRIGIIGFGAMGSLFAARLNSVAEVIMLGSWNAQLRALRQNGLALIERDGRLTAQAIRATDEISEAGRVEIAIILVKSYKTEQAATLAQRILASQGLAVTLQNGLGNFEKIAAAVGEHRVILGSTTQAATMIEPGVVRHAGEGASYLGRPSVPQPLLGELMDLFQRAGLEARLSDDVDSVIWSKLTLNAGINPLTALLRVPNGFLVENEQARQLMIRVVEEAARVARVQGIMLSYSNTAQSALEVAQATAANQSSMLQDVLRGAPTEIDAITGVIVDRGQRHGVPAPLNEKLLYLMRSGAAPVEIEDLQRLLN
jgi:2-dehydropantoate 2-reductase